MPSLSRSLLALLLASLAGCTVVRVDADDGPARLEAGGLIDGHLAVGIPENTSLLDLDLFDGDSDGALVQLKVWKLLRLEVGLAGATVGVGPLDAGLGVLAYDPEPWVQNGPRRTVEDPPAPVEKAPADQALRDAVPAPRPMEVDVEEASGA